MLHTVRGADDVAQSYAELLVDDDDFPPGTDNNTVVRLCDPEYGTCLDQ